MESHLRFEVVSLSPTEKNMVFTYKGRRLGRTEKAKQILDNKEDYLSYLKLVHAGEDSFSDEENDQCTENMEKADSPPEIANKDENFYDTSDIATPEYENSLNHATSPEEHEKMVEEWKAELAKLEDEITTLRQVLGSKVQQSNELKRKLGITPMKELKQDIQQGVKNIKESDAYQKTNAALKTAGQKTSTAFNSFGAFASRKLADVRHSNTFKSIEEKVGNAYTNVKSKVSSSRSDQDLSNSADKAAGDHEELVTSQPQTEKTNPPM